MRIGRAGLLAAGLVEPFVGRVEFWRGNNHDRHSAYGSVSRTRVDKDGGSGLYRVKFAVKLERCVLVTLEYEVGFRYTFVVMRLCVNGNLRHMQRVWNGFYVHQPPTSCSAGTRRPRELAEIDQFEWFGKHKRRPNNKLCRLHSPCRQQGLHRSTASLPVDLMSPNFRTDDRSR